MVPGRLHTDPTGYWRYFDVGKIVSVFIYLSFIYLFVFYLTNTNLTPLLRDGVLNPAGVRFGSAEIYAVTDKFPDIQDSICVGQRRQVDDDERVLLFVKMQHGKKMTQHLDKKLRAAIRAQYSPRHVPKFIFEVEVIPYTVNGKKCEINVKNIVCQRQAAVSGTVANPEALSLYRQYASLPPEKQHGRNANSKI